MNIECSISIIEHIYQDYGSINTELTKINVEHESDGDTNCNWRAWNDPKGLDKGAGRFENWRTN